MFQHDFRWFMNYWKQRRGLMLTVLILTVFSIVARTAYPLMFKFVLDKLTAKAAPSEIRTWVWFLIIVGVYQGLMFAILPNSRAYGNLVFGRLMRETVFRKILRKGHDFFLKFRTGDLITRLTDDIEGSDLKLSWYSCSGVMRPVEMSLVILFSLGVMFSLNWKLTLLVFIPLPFFIWLLARTMGMLEKRAQERQKAISEVNDLLETSISGIRIVKGFCAEKQLGEKLTATLSHRVDTEVSFIRINAMVQTVGLMVQNFGIVIGLFVGGVLTIRGEMTVGSFFAFANYFQFLVEPIFTIGYFFAITKINFAYVDRLKEVENFPEPKRSTVACSESMQKLEFKNISAKFPDTERMILEDVSFAIEPRQTIAVVGPIGCGKSTLVEVALGEMKPESGAVYWNDRNIDQLEPHSRLSHIGLVPQEPLLFSETVTENIRLGDPSISDQAITQSLNASRLESELKLFPHGGNTLLGQRGIELSGGQKQRLALARVLARRPDLLLLDDVTSALDAETEQMFWRNFRTEYPDTAVLVVTHRLATAAQADQVLMLDDGKIVAYGPHLTLMETNDRYRAFVEREETEEAVTK